MCCVSYVNIQNCQSFHLSFSYSKCMYLLFSFHFHWFFMSLNFYFFLSPNFLLLLWNLQYTFCCVGISSKKKTCIFWAHYEFIPNLNRPHFCYYSKSILFFVFIHFNIFQYQICISLCLSNQFQYLFAYFCIYMF